MFNTAEVEHEKRNQQNYNEKATQHNSLNLNSTLYLAYRDISKLLESHLYPKVTRDKIRLLDFGCGVGLSTEIVLSHLNAQSKHVIEAVGVDINEANLEIAQKKLPHVKFKCISKGDRLDDLESFNLIICNFVLVEMKSNEMLHVLSVLKSKLATDGILLVTNPTTKAYHPENKWYSVNNEFPENIPTRKVEGQEKMKYAEDQRIVVQVFSAKNSADSFTFFDYAHTGDAYKKAYKAAGLQLLATHKPLGNPDDGIQWEAEAKISPYKIHVLGR